MRYFLPAWVVALAFLAGCMGADGDAGPMGDPGPAGEQGDPGMSPGAEAVAAELLDSLSFRQELAESLKADSEFVAELAGPPGEVGPQGEPGPAGAQGNDGPQGPRGEPGLSGDATPEDIAVALAADQEFRTTLIEILVADYSEEVRGAQGEPGPPGDAGPQGVEGPRGAQGDVGEQGPQGERGPEGPAGPVGDPGPSALVAVDVYDGPQCEDGGVELRSGIDADDNGVLEEGEETGPPQHLCDGMDGDGGDVDVCVLAPYGTCHNRDIENVFFVGTSQNRFDLRHFDASGSTFDTSQFSYVQLDNAVFQGTSFPNTTLNYAFFTGADLTNANFNSARLSRVSFTDAILTGATFRGASLFPIYFTGVDFSGTDFRNADFYGGNSQSIASFFNTDFTGADFTRAELDYVRCQEGTTFASATLDDVSAVYADFTDMDFTGGSISDGDFDHADFMGATLVDVGGVGAQFQFATLTSANATGADFRDASFQSAQVVGVNFTDANLEGAFGLNPRTCTWSNTTCPDGTNSDDNDGSCDDHLVP